MTKLEELERHLGFAQQALRGAVGSFNRAVTPAERMAASVYIKSAVSLEEFSRQQLALYQKLHPEESKHV